MNTSNPILQPNHVYEFRSLHTPWGTLSGYFDDAALLCKAADEYDGKVPALYVTLNPVKPALLARAYNRIERYAKVTTSDPDILQRLWIVIDCDAVKPAGISSMDAEHQAALDRARVIGDWLHTMDWPDPILADSGNGAHLLYRVELPSDATSTKMVKAILDVLALWFDDAVVVVDRGMFNAARITKLYGSMVCKGEDMPDRPHRRSALLIVPQKIEVVSTELLAKVAARLPQEPPRTRSTTGTPFDLQAFIARHGLRVSKEKPWNGGTVYELEACPFNPEHVRSSWLTQFPSGAMDFGCHHNSCRDKRWAELRARLEPDRPRHRPRDTTDRPRALSRPDPDALSRCTDVGNGERFARQHRDTVRYCYGLKQWFVWNGQRWHPDDGGRITRLAKETALTMYALAAEETEETRRKALAKWAAESETERRLKSMVSLARSEPGIAIEADRLDADPWLLNVLNGTLDLKTGTLRPARREDFITKLMPVVYQPDAVCPIFDGTLDRLFAAVPAIRAYLQRIFGYSLTGLTTEQCFFLFYGTGSNGKSTLLNTVLSLLGDYADASRPETFLAKHGDGGIPNDVAALAGVRYVVSLESEKGKRLAESLVKAMTGNDTLKARFLHKEFFSFTPRFKLFIGTNHKPTIHGTDDGIWRRVRCVPFAVQIADAEKDRHLSAKLETERSGILNWLVQGCQAWQRDGLGEPLEILAATAAYRTEQDVLGVFLHDRCVLEPEAEVSKKDLFQIYLKWCEDGAEHFRLTMRDFGKVLRERGVTDTRTNHAKGWCGIRIKTESEAEPDEEDDAGDEDLYCTPIQEGSDVNLDA